MPCFLNVGNERKTKKYKILVVVPFRLSLQFFTSTPCAGQRIDANGSKSIRRYTKSSGIRDMSWIAEIYFTLKKQKIKFFVELIKVLLSLTESLSCLFAI